MFYNFANNPKVPGLDFTSAAINDSSNFSKMMEASSKREKIVGLISSISQNHDQTVDDAALKSAIEDLDASIDLVSQTRCLTFSWKWASARISSWTRCTTRASSRTTK